MRLFLRALCSLLLVAPLALVAWEGAVPETSPATRAVSGSAAPGCSDVLLVGIDGAAEVAHGSTGFGPVMRTAVNRYRSLADRGGRSLRVQRMGPRFRGTRVLLRSLRDRTPSRRAVTKARFRAWRTPALPKVVTNVVSRIRKNVASCPEQQVVLAGYSQGAMVAHRALLRLRSSDAFPMVVGAVLVGDPDRVRKTAADLFGRPAAPHWSRGRSAQLTTPVADVPVAGTEKRVVTVCSRHDLLCDVRGARADRAMAVHNSYGKGDPRVAVRRAANRLWAHTRAWPKLPSRAPAIVAEVGRHVSRQLPVDVARGAKLVWDNAKGLPPGITLSRDGRLRGTPTRTGDWEVRFTVRNTSPRTPAVTGSAKVSVVSSERVVSSGGMSSCQVRPNGSLWCWGDNAHGQVGDGTRRTRLRPIRIGRDFNWETVSSGGGTTCAIKTTGTLWCWGNNHRGQLGIGDHRARQLTPARVGSWSDWDQVSNSWFHTCGVRDNGTAWCWGFNDRGQLGQNDRVWRINPQRVGQLRQWATISAGGRHTCGTLRDGSGLCWGAGSFGQIGEGEKRRNRLVARRVSGNQEWVRLSTSWSATCGLTESGEAWCWGLNNRGQLGTGNRREAVKPVRVSGPSGVRTIAMGNATTCALEATGDVWCWGSNRYGQYGNGAKVTRLRPIRVMRQSDWLTISAGWFHTCALSPKRVVGCWGNNEQGQLKRGDREDSASPPGWSTPRAVQARIAGPRTKVTTFNILGSEHTRPGADADHYAPGRIRAEWATDIIEDYGSSIVGFQEIQPDQLGAVLKILGNRARAYPGLNRGARAVWTSMIWNPSVWAFVGAETYKIPFLKAERPQPIVRLRHKATGKKVAVLNVHNVSRKDPDRVRQRAAELKIEIAQVKRMQRAGWHIILMGDFNDRRITFCRITRETNLEAVQGGSNRNGRCEMPSQQRLDWIFVSPGIERLATRFDMRRERGRVTDHTVLSATLGVD